MSNAAVKEFLQLCEDSGDKAYGALKNVLEKLEDPAQRSEARKFLGSVEKYINEELSDVDSLATFHFRIKQLSLSDYEGFRENRQKLTLLELPSIFIPEDWSFTFFEGINRHPENGFQGRDIVELGCGNGWISIAVAEKWSPKKVYGLDINPRAIKVAWINLYLNALNSHGAPVVDHEGKTLLDRVEFYESDLLSYCRERNIMLDRIIGCIPQVLCPDPKAMLKIVSENESEEFLFSLSNYCGLQGFVEDQFGLGLVARAAEEGISLLKPSGVMIFNMGGRPGQAVCERLFTRRGFHITKLWQTRVNQAADTDILDFVEIENNSQHRFEFFMGRVSHEPISARTAYTYAKAGGTIAHALTVYECRLQQPNEVKAIFRFLSEGYEQTRGALDLSFEREAVAEEKIPFLAHLAETLDRLSYFPFEIPAGSSRFRNLLSSFLRNYHHILLTPNSVVVLPSRAILIENILRLFSPQLALVDGSLARSLPKKWVTIMPHEALEAKGDSISIPKDSITVVEAPPQSDLVNQLMCHLKPQVVITKIADFEMQTSTAFQQLLDATEKINARLFLDISDYLELSSLPGSNGVLHYLASYSLPLHATIICGLVKNQVYSDLEVAFVISENQTVLSGLSKTTELMQGRTPISSQFYYGCLLHELLAFQLPDRRNVAQRLPCTESEQSTFIKFDDCTRSAINDAELSSCNVPTTPIVRMDLEENKLPTPSAVKVAIFEGFARQNIIESEMDPRPDILSFLKSKYGLCSTHCKELILSDSSPALFSKLVLACVEEDGTLCFPSGSNGAYVCAAKILKSKIKFIPTSSIDSFKLTGSLLDEFLKSVKRPWVYISGPTINPTGILYTNEELKSILTACKVHKARVIIDTSVSGLEFMDDTYGTWNLEEACTEDGIDSHAIALLGGLSNHLLSGGIEFSFAALSEEVFIGGFREVPHMSKPHSTLKYSIKKLLNMLDGKSANLVEDVDLQKKILQRRALELEKVLVECRWKAITPSGGVSLVARPFAYEGKTTSYTEADGTVKDITIDSTNIHDAIFHTTGLYVNNSAWTGIPKYLRFVISGEEEEFHSALKCLRKFKEHVFNKESI